MRSLTKIFGGKKYLSKHIIANLSPVFDKIQNYVEPYCGMINVLINKPKLNHTEYANDLDPQIYWMLYYAQNYPQLFTDKLKTVTYSEETFNNALNYLKTYSFDNTFEFAVAAYIRKRMSRMADGKNYSWSERLRGGQPESLNAWETSIDNIATFSNRIKDVILSNQDAFNFMLTHDFKTRDKAKTLYYCDATYIGDKRTTKKVYDCEMSVEQHKQLCDFANTTKNYIAISGYENKYYNEWLKNFNVVGKEIVNHSGQNKKKNKRVELLWKNW